MTIQDHDFLLRLTFRTDFPHANIPPLPQRYHVIARVLQTELGRLTDELVSFTWIVYQSGEEEAVFEGFPVQKEVGDTEVESGGQQ